MSTQTHQDSQFFNLHLEGFANLFDARVVTPKPGQRFEPYLAVRASYLQGKGDNANPLFVSLKVVGTNAKALVERFMNCINDTNKSVSAVIKSGDISFTASDKDPVPGEERKVWVSARLLSFKYLQVTDKSTGQKLERLSQQQLVELCGGTRAPSVVPVANSSTAVANTVASPSQVAEPLPDTVKLDPDAPDFKQRKAELKQAGYRWDKDSQAWRAPQAA